MAKYKNIYESWKKNPIQFWKNLSKDIDWNTKPSKIFDDEKTPFNRWFPEATLNTSYNAIDRHVIAGKGDQDAIIYDSPITNVKRKISYSELQYQVSKFAGALLKQGVQKGDRVIIYMPMIQIGRASCRERV